MERPNTLPVITENPSAAAVPERRACRRADPGYLRYPQSEHL